MAVGIASLQAGGDVVTLANAEVRLDSASAAITFCRAIIHVAADTINVKLLAIGAALDHLLLAVREPIGSRLRVVNWLIARHANAAAGRGEVFAVQAHTTTSGRPNIRDCGSLTRYT